MTDHDRLPILAAAHGAPDITIRPIRGGRRDVDVGAALDVGPIADVMPRLRHFFAEMDAYADGVKADPIAMTHALARLETLLADVRYVRDTVKRHAAAALADNRIRRLTVANVATVEGSSSVHRTEWQHARLLADMLDRWEVRIIAPTGELIESHIAARRLLEWFGPDWRLTPIRQAGLNPDDYCTVATDDDGKPQRTQEVKMVDNHIRKIGGPA